MFDEYRKKLENIGENSDKVFKKVAKQGAIFFQKEAVRLTDQEKLVDTGTYKRNWVGEQTEIQGEQAIIGANPIEYASYLEDGYNIKRAHFVPFEAGSGTTKAGKHWETKGMEGTPKTKEFIASFRAKYPNAKGFMAKARRFRGRKIGRRAIDRTRYYCIKRLDDLFDKLFTKYHQSFTQSD